jgi:hypothetical protein
LKRPRKLSNTFVRKGTCRTINLKNSAGSIHIRFLEDGRLSIYKGFGNPKDENYWEIIHESHLINVKT